MAASDPFELLGLDRDATTAEVRTARRLLAKTHHPDHGGDEHAMQAVNEAAAVALQAIERRRRDQAEPTPSAESDRDDSNGSEPEPIHRDRGERAPGGRVVHDMPSFTVEALPVDTFEALLVVTSWLGEVLDEEPPYRLDTYLYEPFDCWCGLDVVPDAGGSTVSLAVAGIDGAPTPDVLAVRDAWIANLNTVDWP